MIPSNRLSASTASPEPLLPRYQPRRRPRGERLRSDGTDNALKAHLESAAVVVGGHVCRTEYNRGPRAPTPPVPAARSPPAAPSVHSVLSEIFGNVVFGCRGEAKRGEEGASKVSSGCPRVRSTTTCDLIMESPASAFLALRNTPSRAVPPYAYARRPPPEVPPVPHHRIALFFSIRSSFFFSLF